MIGWHHQLNGCEFERAPGDGEGQGGLVCCSSWGHKESKTTEGLNNTRHVKRCLSLLVIRETQIKTTVHYHLTQVRRAIILKHLQITNAGKGVEKREPFYMLVRM